MNWKGIKNLLIVLLFFADIFLGYMLISQNRQGKYDENAIDNASEILAQSGIIADRSILEKEEADLPLCTVSVSKNTETVARKFLKGNISDSFAVPDGVAFFTDNGEQLKLTDDLSLLYSEDGTIKDTEAVTLSEPTEKDTENYSAVLEKFFTPSGTYDDKFGFEISGIFVDTDSVFVSAVQTLNDVKIQNHTVFCEIKDGGVIYASGTWCFLPIKEKKSAHIIDGINILFIEKNNSDTSIDISEESEESEEAHEQKTETTSDALDKILYPEFSSLPDEANERTVVSLDRCYCSARTFGGDIILIVPSYRLEWLDGSVSYYNAITGEPKNFEN